MTTAAPPPSTQLVPAVHIALWSVFSDDAERFSLLPGTTLHDSDGTVPSLLCVLYTDGTPHTRLFVYKECDGVHRYAAQLYDWDAARGANRVLSERLRGRSLVTLLRQFEPTLSRLLEARPARA